MLSRTRITIQAALKPKALCCFRREFPVSWAVLFLASGQIVAEFFTLLVGRSGIFELLFYILCFFFLLRKPCAFPWHILLIGLLSIRLIAFYAPVTTTPVHDASLFVEIEEIPFSYRRGEVRYQVKVIRSLTTDLVWPASGDRLICKAPALPWRNTENLYPGQQAQFRVSARPFSAKRNPFSYQAKLLRRGVSGYCNIRFASKPLGEASVISKFREKIVLHAHSAINNYGNSGLLLSLAAGFKNEIPENLEQTFKRSGLAHLLVVSGYHVGMVFGLVLSLSLLLFRFFPPALWKRRVAMLLSIVVTCGYVSLTGFSGSGIRSLVASGSILVSFFSFREIPFLERISLALLVLFLLWPGCVFEAGIELTAAALLGIALGIRKQNGEIHRGTFITVPLMASLCTAMVTGVRFGEVSLAGLILNPFVAPLIAFIACQVGIGTFLLSFSGIDFGSWGLRAVCSLLAKLSDWVGVIADYPLSMISSDHFFFYLFIPGCLLIILRVVSQRIESFLHFFGLFPTAEVEKLRNTESLHLAEVLNDSSHSPHHAAQWISGSVEANSGLPIQSFRKPLEK